MKPRRPMRWWTHVLPWLTDNPIDSGGNEWLETAHLATIFDCRAIDWKFALETGKAAYEEIGPLKKIVRLPYPQCYFEFGSYGVLADECDVHEDYAEEDGSPVQDSIVW